MYAIYAFVESRLQTQHSYLFVYSLEIILLLKSGSGLKFIVVPWNRSIAVSGR